ncbi:Cytoplasmic thioredoxin isoenzyme 2 [Physocladia obscura]|uniref:Cytoplasmic thioredoxin isoenzyme 2 n=1 Tax=Physocladia obscura TaxID=109957 RepID=A0AAD5XGF4_9FUNG|nr:Cytoplasmic thioredoxin isoenzyme 2 [Physocladia obscura]
MGESVQEVKTYEEYLQLINGDKTGVVGECLHGSDWLLALPHRDTDWFATWCGSCKAISPVFAELSRDNDNLVFFKVDVDEVPEAAEAAGIRALPTFQFYQQGKKVDELVGAHAAKLKGLVAQVPVNPRQE